MEGGRLEFLKWSPEEVCAVHSLRYKLVIVRGLPLHLWSLEIFRAIGGLCGGLISVEDETRYLDNCMEARFKVHCRSIEKIPISSPCSTGVKNLI